MSFVTEFIKGIRSGMKSIVLMARTQVYDGDGLFRHPDMLSNIRRDN